MKKNIEFVKRADIWTEKLTVKAAFTLAELLITIVAIGVVAVITMDIRYDVNGDKYPNKIGRDIFWYNFCWNYGNNTKAGFIPYLKYDVFSRTEALQKCQNSPVYCSVLLEYDCWEFKKDYPYKL